MTELDAYGDAWKQQAEVEWEPVANGFGKKVTMSVDSTFDGDPSTWIIGKLRTVQLISADVGGVKETRSRRLEHNAKTGVHEKLIVEPGSSDPEIRLDLSFEYEPHGLLHVITTSDLKRSERRVVVDYDKTRSMFPEVITNPAGNARMRVYHSALGVLGTEEDENGVATRWQYDAFGRLRDEIAPHGGNLAVAYRRSSFGGLEISRHRAGGSGDVRSFDPLQREMQRRWQGFDGRWLFQRSLVRQCGPRGHRQPPVPRR